MNAPIDIQRHKLSVEDFHRMGEAGILPDDSRVELIDGELIDMAPIGSLHAGIVCRLNLLLAKAVDASQAISWVQSPLMLPPCSEPIPDLMLLRPRQDFYTEALPQVHDALLVVEVADSSLAYDRGLKLALYARHGAPEVWIVDVRARIIEAYRQPSEERYAQCLTPAFDEALSPMLVSGLYISASQLFP